MVPQTKVFVGSLPQGSKPEDLRRLFERFGAVTECDIMNRCGFVHMQTEDMATAAIRSLHNSTFNGGVITVERGRIKERGPRGPGGPPRGPGGPGGPGGMRGPAMRNGAPGMGDGAPRRPGGGGPMRGPPMGGRDPAPYMRDSRPPMRDSRGPPMGGMGMRNGMGGGGGYERSMERPGAMGGGYPDDRFNGYGGEDRRGFALVDGRGRGDGGYGAPGGGMYPEERRYGMEERGPVHGYGERPVYPDERDMLDRRGGGMRPPMPMAPSHAYERSAPQRPAPMGNGDMFSRRSPPPMRAGGYGDRDPYAQQFPPMGRLY